MMNQRFRLLSCILLFLLPLSGFSQTDEEAIPGKKGKGAKGFHAGFYIGYYYANKSTTTLYDGWGYDENGKRNDFATSFMRRRIVDDYGGGNGQTDYVAAALGVNHGEWSFTESDMPAAVKYARALAFGLQLNYGFTKKDAVLVNVNVCKMALNGNFTIVITNPNIGSQMPGYQNIETFSITGTEQRLMIQAGYRRILGDNEMLNFFVEIGPAINITKYINNQAAINSLGIDLSFYYHQPYYPTYNASYLRGTGLGAFAALGMNLSPNPKWTLQLLYDPSFEKINIGLEPKMALQHALGLRGFYNF